MLPALSALAADQHDLRREDRHQGGGGGPCGRRGRSKDRSRLLVAAVGEGAQLVDSLACLHETRTPRLGDEGGVRGDRLEAAPLAAGAGGTLEGGGRVAELARAATVPSVDVSTGDHAEADPVT